MEERSFLHSVAGTGGDPAQPDDHCEIASFLRTPPNNALAEQALLSCCFLDDDNEVVGECLTAGLKAEMFFRPDHQILFSAIRECWEKGETLELEISTATVLQNRGQLEEIGGYMGIARLSGTSIVGTAASYRQWLGEVMTRWKARELLRSFAEETEKLYTGGSVDEAIGRSEMKLIALSDTRSRTLSGAESAAQKVQENFRSICINRNAECRFQVAMIRDALISG